MIVLCDIKCWYNDTDSTVGKLMHTLMGTGGNIKLFLLIWDCVITSIITILTLMRNADRYKNGKFSFLLNCFVNLEIFFY